METMKIVLFIYCIIFYIVFSISLFFILSKTDEKRILGIIPIVNLFIYYKIIKVEWYYLLIPILNIVIFISSPYKLGYEFNQNETSKTLGVFFPIIYFPYIAFSDCKYLRKKRNYLGLTSIKDIEKLEKKIEVQCNQEDYLEKNIKKYQKIKKKIKPIEMQENNINSLISNLDTIEYNDEYILDEDITQIDNQITKNEFNDNVIEVSDGIFEIDEDIIEYDRIENINRIEELNINENTEVLDKTEYKQVMPEQKEDVDIVFNNYEQKKGDINKEYKCPNCNTLLIGHHKICPGCNKNIEEIMNI